MNPLARASMASQRDGFYYLFALLEIGESMMHEGRQWPKHRTTRNLYKTIQSCRIITNNTVNEKPKVVGGENGKTVTAAVATTPKTRTLLVVMILLSITVRVDQVHLTAIATTTGIITLIIRRILDGRNRTRNKSQGSIGFRITIIKSNTTIIYRHCQTKTFAQNTRRTRRQNHRVDLQLSIVLVLQQTTTENVRLQLITIPRRLAQPHQLLQFLLPPKQPQV